MPTEYQFEKEPIKTLSEIKPGCTYLNSYKGINTMIFYVIGRISETSFLISILNYGRCPFYWEKEYRLQINSTSSMLDFIFKEAKTYDPRKHNFTSNNRITPILI